MVAELLAEIAWPLEVELDDGGLNFSMVSVVQRDLEVETLVLQFILDHRTNFSFELACVFGGDRAN